MESLPDLTIIKELRKKLYISQKELGQKLGIQQSTISRIENGTIDPPYSKFKTIYEYLVNESIKRAPTSITANNVMTTEIYSVNPKASVREAVELMNQHKISQIPIISEDGINVGSITSKKNPKINY